MHYETDIRPVADTGDLVFFSGVSAISRGIKALTASNWSHVGSVWKSLEMGGTLFLVESTTLNKNPDVQTGELIKGVQMHRLSDALRSYPGERTFGFRKLHGDRSEAFRQQFINFYNAQRGKPYEQDRVALALSAMPGVSDDPEGWDSWFCSELSIELLQQSGVVDDAFASDGFTPRNLSGRMLNRFLINGWDADRTQRFQFDGTETGQLL